MKCPRCSAENGVRFEDMIYLIEKFGLVNCGCCGNWSNGLAWRWGPGWFDQPNIVERFRRVMEMAKCDQ